MAGNLFNPDHAPWEQRDAESSAAFAAFLAYRNLGPGRSLSKAWEASKGDRKGIGVPGQWRQWSVTHRWIDRSRAWDRFQDAEAARVAAERYADQLLKYREEALKRVDLTAQIALKIAANIAARDIAGGPMNLREAAVAARAVAALSDSVTNLQALILGLQAKEAGTIRRNPNRDEDDED